MTTSSDPRGWTSLLRLMLAGAVVVPLLILALWADHSWRIAYDRARSAAQGNAELVREFALGVLTTQQAVLDHVSTLVEDAAEREMDETLLRQRLSALDLRLDGVLNLGVIDAQGRLVLSSRVHPISADLSDRGYFMAIRDGARSIQLDRVVQRPSGQDAMVVVRRREGEPFRGAILSTISIGSFTDFFGRIADSPQASASLLRADGMLLVRHTPAAPPVRLPPDAPAMRAIAGGDSGVYRTVALSDGIERIYGFARLNQMPLYAHFGVPVGAVRAEWRQGMVPVTVALLLTAALGCLGVLTMRNRVQATLDRSRLAEAEARTRVQQSLLQELHHRVKNSLTLVQSLIRLRGGQPGPEADALLEQRVAALAQVHDLLHVTGISSRLDVPAFLARLIANPALVPPERGIRVTCHADPLEVGLEQAAPLALIVTELLTNALKHAFPDARTGTIALTLRTQGANAVLRVSDDGVGLASPKPAARRSGLRLAERLAQQLDGTLTIEPGPGTSFRLEFPVQPASAGNVPGG